tara:strand:- start:622 stop:726 length:105 start_codon:yes stop_codon:yes gene_type:complete
MIYLHIYNPIKEQMDAIDAYLFMHHRINFSPLYK